MFGHAGASQHSQFSPEREAPTSQPPPKDTFTPRRLGDYELLEPIGQGAVGIVYKARQLSLDRIVALKLLASGTLASPEVIHRFRTEAVAAGSLQHPNIVAVHEVGLTEGQHYLVMDYVAGPTLAALVRKGPLAARRAAQLARTIAEAVHFAHERGILHRDLKPSNVLLDADDQPRVTDFGLAKRLSGSQPSTLNPQLTLSGQVLGSPGFMPPEQASGRRGQLGRRSDVYGLGAILYFLLTGRAPFLGEAVTDLLRQVVNDEPLAPRLLNPATPPDLQTICLKCLEKEPDRRYPTAQAVAEELGRFLRAEPILAQPLGMAGKAWRWCRRKPVVASLGAAALVLLLVIGVGSPLALSRINEQRLAAVKWTREAELYAYAAHINLAQQYLKAGNLGRTRELLELARRHSPQTPDPRGWEWAYLHEQSRGDAEFVLEKLSTGAKITISPDGRWLAIALRYGQVHLWDLSTRTLAKVLGQEFNAPTVVFFSPDSRLLAFKEMGEGLANKYVIWDIMAHARRLELITTNFLGEGAFLPGGRGLIGGELVGPDGTRGLALWDLSSQRTKATFRFTTKGGYLFAGNDARMTADGNLLLCGDIDGMVKILDTRVLEFVGSFPAHEGGISALALSPDGHLMATAQADSGTAIKLWDVESALRAARIGATVQPLASLDGHESWPTSLSFSPDSQILASGSMDHTIRIWDVGSRKGRKLQGHENHIISVQFAPDGRLYSAGRDGLVCAWSLDAPIRPTGPERRALKLRSVSLPPAGQQLAAVHQDGTADLVELVSGAKPTPLPELGADNALIAYSGDGRLLYVAKRSGEIVVWNPDQRRAVRQLPGNAVATFCKTSQDGKLLVVVDQQNRVGVWQTLSWQQKTHWRLERMAAYALSPDGGLLVTGEEMGLVRLWDPLTGKQVGKLVHTKERTTDLAFSADGRLLAAASDGGPVTVWERSSLRQVALLSGHPVSTSSLAFSPDGRRLATGSADKEAAKLWDTATWQEMITLESPGVTLWELAFSPDGNRLLAVDGANNLLIWHAPPVENSQSLGNAGRAFGNPKKDR
jgi:WD40 repeat protein